MNGYVENVWFTNNTIYRPFGSGPASILVVDNGAEGLTGDSRILNNIFVSAVPLFDVTLPSSPQIVPQIDHNAYVYLGSASPFKAENSAVSWSAWRLEYNATFDGNSFYSDTDPLYFVAPTARDDFYLSSGHPLRDVGIHVPAKNQTPALWPDVVGFGSFTPTDEVDHYGGARYNGGRDLGADEYDNN